MAETVLKLTNLSWKPAQLPNAALILVCMQAEFRTGPLRLRNVDAAVDEAAYLLDHFREACAPVIHIARDGGTGEFFNRETPGGRFISAVAPREGELVLETRSPNPFVSTTLKSELRARQIEDVVFAGFSSHSSLSSAVRYAAEHGFRPTVVSSACASRDLPAPGGITLPAEVIHLAAMASLADRHAAIVEHARQILGQPVLS